jgi:hypothetical protein
MSALATSSGTRICRTVAIPSNELDEPRAVTFSAKKADLSHVADLAGAGHFLMLRF